MIKIGETTIERVYVGNDVAGIAAIGDVEIYVDKYGGLPVVVDGLDYSRSNGLVTDGDKRNNVFIAGPFDTGDSSRKSYILSQNFHGNTFVIRWFDDLSAKSIDYWSYAADAIRTINSAGRYICASVPVDAAPFVWIYDNTNKHFVYKGCKAQPTI